MTQAVMNRLHLDIRVGTGLVGDERVAVLEGECARLVAVGATRVQLLVADEENESCLVMQDVEGNEFCWPEGPGTCAGPMSARQHGHRGGRAQPSP